MNAFDSNKKHKKMPLNLSTATTKEILDDLQQYIGASGQLEWSELENRIIKEGDTDDLLLHGNPVARGGVRPTHLPPNP